MKAQLQLFIGPIGIGLSHPERERNTGSPVCASCQEQIIWIALFGERRIQFYLRVNVCNAVRRFVPIESLNTISPRVDATTWGL
jgi:hypothetical protein